MNKIVKIAFNFLLDLNFVKDTEFELPVMEENN